MDAEQPTNSTDGLPRQTGRSIPQKPAAKRRIPDNERLVISWFGWDIAHRELIADETFRCWLRRFFALCQERGWIFERLWTATNIMIGCPSRSVTRRAFFLFQRDWDALNQEFGFRFTGALWLMAAAGKDDGDLPFEIYFAGAKRHGDSIGRPSRHQRKSMKTTDSKSQPGSQKGRLITDLATRMKHVATTWEGALRHSGSVKKRLAEDARDQEKKRSGNEERR